MVSNIDRLDALKDTVAIVGIGETDYQADYQAGHERGSGAKTPYQLAVTAVRRALDDAGLQKSDIDGLCASGQLSAYRTAEVFGLNPSWSQGGGNASVCLIAAVQAINAGLCNTVLCVYGNAQRSVNTQYGGPQAAGPLAYTFYAPWGMTSQGGLWALTFRRHQLQYGTTSEQLGAVAVAFRKHALMNPNAVMHGRPMTLEDYLESRFIARPLRIFDYCLINDGGVAFIVQRADMARDLKNVPIMVSGIGNSEEVTDATQLRPRLKNYYHGSHHGVRDQVYPMAGVGPKDIDVFATYDSFTMHLLLSLEGMGFCEEGEGGAFVQDGRIEIGGELPCNTSGGMLSESYMQSWNHQPELVRQLRHAYEGTERQVEGAEIGQWVYDGNGLSSSVIYTRGN